VAEAVGRNLEAELEVVSAPGVVSEIQVLDEYALLLVSAVVDVTDPISLEVSMIGSVSVFAVLLSSNVVEKLREVISVEEGRLS
jgi:hypothetical protein